MSENNKECFVGRKRDRQFCTSIACSFVKQRTRHIARYRIEDLGLQIGNAEGDGRGYCFRLAVSDEVDVCRGRAPMNVVNGRRLRLEVRQDMQSGESAARPRLAKERSVPDAHASIRRRSRTAAPNLAGQFLVTQLLRGRHNSLRPQRLLAHDNTSGFKITLNELQ